MEQGWPASGWPEIEIFQYPEIASAQGDMELRAQFEEKYGVPARKAWASHGTVYGSAAVDKKSGSNGGIHGGIHGAAPFDGDGLEESVAETEFAQRLAAESRQAEERGRGQGQEQGLEQGLAQGREEASRRLEAERSRLFAQAADLAASFAEDRDRYLHRLEQEAVRLALAIAARILRREAQMDPLLLTGAVRVALGQLALSTVVRLRVPVQDQPLWEEAVARMPGLALRPKVIGEPGMELGECRMETELGSADLGLWSQLKEIERGFFDRVGSHRTQAESGSRVAESSPTMETGTSASDTWLEFEAGQAKAEARESMLAECEASQ